MESPPISEEEFSKVLQLEAQAEDCKEKLRSLQCQLAQLLEDTEAAEELFLESGQSEEFDDLENALEGTDDEERQDDEWAELQDSEAGEEQILKDQDEKPGTSPKPELKPVRDDATLNKDLKKKILDLYKLTGEKGGDPDPITQLDKIKAFLQDTSNHLKVYHDGGKTRGGTSACQCQMRKDAKEEQTQNELQEQNEIRKQRILVKTQELLKAREIEKDLQGGQQKDRRLLSPGGVQELPEWIVKLQKKMAMKTRAQAASSKTQTAKTNSCLPSVPFLFKSRIKPRDPWPPALIKEIVYRSERWHRPCRLINNPPGKS